MYENFSVIFSGIIPSNPLAYPGGVRQKRNHGRIVPNHSAFRKRNRFGVSACPASASKNDSAAIRSAGNGLSEQKSDARSPNAGPFHLCFMASEESNYKTGRCLTLRSDFRTKEGAFSPISIGKRAGEGNRTPVCSLGSCRSAIELHPRRDFRFSIADVRFATRKNHCHEITSSDAENVVVPLLNPGDFPSLPADHAITPWLSGSAPAPVSAV
jgi:hypothetical protein